MLCFSLYLFLWNSDKAMVTFTINDNLPVTISEQKLRNGNTVLYIQHLCITTFLKQFQGYNVSAISFQWLDSDFEEKSTISNEQMNAMEFIPMLSGLDIPVINLDFKLDENILVSTDMRGDIFCNAGDHEIKAILKKLKPHLV